MNENQSPEHDVSNSSLHSPKFPKKKVAIVMAYLGTGYQGMQTNPNARTIESVLFKVLCSCGFVSESNSVDQKKVGLMRACRTDKGVHAAMQIVSVKILMTKKLEEITCILNDVLPPEIRVCGVHPVSQNFNSKLHCDSRVYEYLIPTFMFKRIDESNFFLTKSNLSKENLEPESDSEDEEECDFDQTIHHKPTFDSVSTLTQESSEEQVSYRISESELQQLRCILSMFVGSHHFHNYTIKKSSSDPSSRRQIWSFSTSEPFVVKNTFSSQKANSNSSLEWIKLSVHGIAVLIMKLGGDPNTVIYKSLSVSERINVPKAPGLGLLLAETRFSRYNQRIQDRVELSYSTYSSAIDSFKESFIYPEVFKEEFLGNCFYGWWSAISNHSYDYTYVLETPTAEIQPNQPHAKKSRVES